MPILPVNIGLVWRRNKRWVIVKWIWDNRLILVLVVGIICRIGIWVLIWVEITILVILHIWSQIRVLVKINILTEIKVLVLRVWVVIRTISILIVRILIWLISRVLVIILVTHEVWVIIWVIREIILTWKHHWYHIWLRLIHTAFWSNWIIIIKRWGYCFLRWLILIFLRIHIRILLFWVIMLLVISLIIISLNSYLWTLCWL